VAAQFNIRDMTDRDLDAVCRIETESFSDPWHRGAFEEDLRSRHTYCPVIAEPTGSIVGYACLMLFAEEAHLTNIAVDPAWRHKGIGISLMEHLLSKAEKDGCRAMFLDVRSSNSGAQRFYLKQGFTELYWRKMYYRNPPEDAIVMVRPLAGKDSDG
jgi:ribosomal-protein-alanine N-acetyltransferase